MTSEIETDRVHVQIRFKNAEEIFEGTVEQTWLMLDRFFNQLLPSFEVANRLLLNVDIQTLAKDCEGLIAFSPEGPNILVSKNKLTDNETLALWLLACYLGNKLKLLNSDSFSKENLQAKIGKSSKITSTRLGELVKLEWATKTSNDEFKITTFGVSQMQKEVLPRIISKACI